MVKNIPKILKTIYNLLSHITLIRKIAYTENKEQLSGCFQTKRLNCAIEGNIE